MRAKRGQQAGRGSGCAAVLFHLDSSVFVSVSVHLRRLAMDQGGRRASSRFVLYRFTSIDKTSGAVRLHLDSHRFISIRIDSRRFATYSSKRRCLWYDLPRFQCACASFSIVLDSYRFASTCVDVDTQHTTSFPTCLNQILDRSQFLSIRHIRKPHKIMQCQR